MTRKNDTPKRKKGLSVFLTVLMVLSVVAMSAAFVAPVAAAVDDPGEPTNVAIGEDSTNQDIVGVDFDTDDDAVIDISALNATANLSAVEDSDITLGGGTVDDADATFDLSEANITIDSSGTTDVSTVTDIHIDNINTSESDAETGLSYTVYHDGDSDETSEFNLGSSAAEAGPIAYFDGSGDQTIEIVFEEGDYTHLDGSNQHVTVYDKEGSEVSLSGTVDANQQRVTIQDIDEDLTVDSIQAPTVNVLGVNHSVTATSTSITHDGIHGEEFAGETFAIVTDTENEWVNITTPDVTDQERATGEQSRVRLLETDRDWNDENVTIGFLDDASPPPVYTSELRDFGAIDVSLNETSVSEGDDVEVTVTADRVANRFVDVGLVDDDGNVVEAHWGEGYDSEGEFTAVFSDLDEGEYTVRAADSTSDLGDSEDLSVAEVDVDEFEFGDFTADEFANERGDWLEFSIEVENPENYVDEEVTILIEEDDYEANITIDDVNLAEDEDELVIRWNTYEAGKSTQGADIVSDEEVFTSENATVTINDETPVEEDFRLNTGVYAAELYEDVDEIRQDSASLVVNERHTGDVDVSIAPMGAGDLDEYTIDQVLANTSEYNDVAINDTLVLTWDVSGIFSYGFDNIDADPADVEFSDNVSLEFVNQESPAYQSPDDFDETEDGVYVVPDADDNKVYVVIDTEENPELEELQAWDVTFTVDSDIADEETAENEFEVLERVLEFYTVEEPIDVIPENNSEILGNTTLAPGTEVSGEWDFRPEGIGTFDDVEVEVVDGERHFTFVEDFSDFEDHIDEEFTIEASAPGSETGEVTAVWSDTAEPDTKTSAQEMRELLDEIKDLLGVDDDDEILGAIEDLQDELDEVTQERDELQDRVDELEDEKAELEGEISDLNDKIDELESDLEDAEDANDELQEALDQAEADLAEAQAEIDQLEVDLAAAQQDAQDWMTAYEELQDDIAAWQDASDADSPEELEGLIGELNDAISSLEDDVADRDSTIEELEGDIADLNDEIDSLEEERDDLQDQLDDAQADDDDDQPAFGPVAALIAILAGGALVARRRLA